MKALSYLIITIGLPTSCLAQDFHKGGFFDSDVSQAGYFSTEQVGIPLRTNTSPSSKYKSDTWTLSPQQAAGLKVNNAENAEKERKDAGQEQSAGDSFEVTATKD